MLAVEIARPTKRYVRVTLTRATANAAVVGIVAVQSSPAEAPVTQDTPGQVNELAMRPNEQEKKSGERLTKKGGTEIRCRVSL